MRYLVDTNVLSETTKASPNPGVVEWLRDHEEHICVNPVILGEIRFGIRLLGPGRSRDALDVWFTEVVRRIRCVPIDTKTGLRWAELLVALRSRGRSMPIKDSLIAATGLAFGLVVVTRDSKDFEAAGAEIVNPFSGGGGSRTRLRNGE